MPSGKAPYPKKKNVESGRADKKKPVRGGYERSASTPQATGRSISYGTGISIRYPLPDSTSNARGEYVGTKRKKKNGR